LGRGQWEKVGTEGPVDINVVQQVCFGNNKISDLRCDHPPARQPAGPPPLHASRVSFVTMYHTRTKTPRLAPSGRNEERHVCVSLSPTRNGDLQSSLAVSVCLSRDRCGCVSARVSASARHAQHARAARVGQCSHCPSWQNQTAPRSHQQHAGYATATMHNVEIRKRLILTCHRRGIGMHCTSYTPGSLIFFFAE
jgi:hypothetical protein